MDDISYLIVQKFENILSKFENLERILNHQDEYKCYRKFFSCINPSDYKGISREPLSAVPESFSAEFDLHEPSAQYLIAKLEEENISSEDLIFSFQKLKEVFSQIIKKDDYEIIRVDRNNFISNPNVLGFDIGYWGGDHFSIIADTLIIPTWHGPPNEAYSDLLVFAKRLNKNLLFSTFEDANDFKAYYKSRKWAECEAVEGEFCIQQIENVPKDILHT